MPEEIGVQQGGFVIVIGIPLGGANEEVDDVGEIVSAVDALNEAAVIVKVLEAVVGCKDMDTTVEGVKILSLD